jgi:hypothetical protein
VPIQFLSTPVELRRHLKRLVRASQRIDLFVRAFGDAELTDLLARAARRGTEVNLTTSLDAPTDPAQVQTLLEAGANVGTFAPASHRGRRIARFAPGAIIFDAEEPWFTAALVGLDELTDAAIAKHLGAAMLVESGTFDGTDEAGNALLQVLNWGDTINHAPLDAKALARRSGAKVAPAAEGGQEEPPRIVELKPGVAGYASPVSWQRLRGCDWGTYWAALLEADRMRGARRRDGLAGERGWLAGIDAAQAAFRRGPGGWSAGDVRALLVGDAPPANVLGRSASRRLEIMLEDDAFRAALHAAIEACIASPEPAAMRAALEPLVTGAGVSVPELSRLLALAAPDRFFSIADDAMQLRMSSVVGFDLTERSALQDHLSRYLDAIAVVRAFPWAAESSAERSSEHPLEPDAWMKRVALLGSLVW